jgi:hypothetical protein
MSAVARELRSWEQWNQRYLTAALDSVRAALAAHAGKGREGPSEGEELEAIAAHMPAPPALEAVRRLFDLTAFERDVLLLCAGLELAADFGPLCAAAQGDAQRAWPTFGLALAALPGAHWSALSPGSPLRYWRLVHVEAGQALTRGALSIDERILHYLVGIDQLDATLAPLVRPLPPPQALVDSHAGIGDEIGAVWFGAGEWSEMAVIQLAGREVAAMRAIASAASQRLSCSAHLMPVAAIPADAAELDRLRRTWQREAALSHSVLVLDCEAVDRSDRLRTAAIARFVEEGSGPLVLTAEERLGPWQRPVLSFDVAKPTPGEQRDLWQAGLGASADALHGQLDAIVSQFHLGAPLITAACQAALGRLAGARPDADPPAPESLGSALWKVCRSQARPQLADLAQAIEPAARREELVLPASQLSLLDEIAAQVRQRRRVYETWGFERKGRRGLGISALFAGASGTGKTMAAEVLARELSLDLFRIDLSAVVSKYIGETEKNLRRVFDAAESGGAILLFDEADALFGKRSEVKDSHDRHANIEVSYLLQCMECYRGLAILTTNLKDALDAAFLRRLRFVVSFPFPDEAQRAEIWRHIFPSDTPTAGLDPLKLARLNATGGNIRNIALNAAFLAADRDEPVCMQHILRAARREYAKLERPLTSAETKDW